MVLPNQLNSPFSDSQPAQIPKAQSTIQQIANHKPITINDPKSTMLLMFWRWLLRIAVGGVVCALLVLAPDGSSSASRLASTMPGCA